MECDESTEESFPDLCTQTSAESCLTALTLKLSVTVILACLQEGGILLSLHI